MVNPLDALKGSEINIDLASLILPGLKIFIVVFIIFFAISLIVCIYKKDSFKKYLVWDFLVSIILTIILMLFLFIKNFMSKFI